MSLTPGLPAVEFGNMTDAQVADRIARLIEVGGRRGVRAWLYPKQICDSAQQCSTQMLAWVHFYVDSPIKVLFERQHREQLTDDDMKDYVRDSFPKVERRCSG